MAQRLTFFILLVLPLFSNGQKLVDEVKKKYFGTYLGEIPTYSLDTGTDLVQVNATDLKIQLDADYVIVDLGKEHFTGTYSVLFQGVDYYVLTVQLEEQLSPERLVVHMKTKSMTREGIYPQPNAELKKLSKKELKNVQ